MKKLFWLCFLIIVLYKMFVLLNMLPPVIPHGDIVYHVMDSILSIINQFAMGISGAIVFYYISLFFNTKNNMDVAYEIRGDILNVLRHHAKILENIKYFKKIKKDTYDIFLWKDIINLLNVIKNSPKLKNEYVYDKYFEDYLDYKIEYEYEKTIGEYFLEVDENTLVQDIDDFNIYNKKLSIYINDFKINTSFLYYLKGALEGVNTFIDPDYSDDLFQYNSILKSELKSKNVEADKMTDLKKCICLGYLKFLTDTINCFNIFDDYISSVEKNKLINFIKMIK
ncbi:hypothetical protein [Clostridium ljungdahlii]|uniref:Phage abortive infection protein n=1 Tax=Clostridium ljungdahlii TaxID=1538 RepID=A0A170NC53_9CLOT|nr:hypothetical protein [Clostridium ljungdahlii]OAA83280.1 hypothetical protein WY13_03608 [Clostridium ljungdahlii]